HTTAVYDRSAAAGETANFIHRFGGILQECPAYFNDFCHETSPAVGSYPNIKFKFWTACPAAPFTRLSRTETITVLSPLATVPMTQRLVFVTLWTFGSCPGDNT